MIAVRPLGLKTTKKAAKIKLLSKSNHHING